MTQGATDVPGVTDVQDTDTTPVFSRFHKLVIAVLCVAVQALVLSATLFMAQHYNHQSFEDDAQHLLQAMSHVVSASEGVITTLSGLYQANEALDRHELAAITEQLFETNAFISDIVRFRVVHDEELDSFHAEMTEDGLFNFTVRPFRLDSEPSTPTKRLAPIVQVEPNDPLLSTHVGVDLLSTDGFGAALREALVSRHGTMLSKSWSAGQQSHLAMMIPTYFGLYVPTTSDERDAQLEGGFIASIDLEQPLGNIIDENNFSRVDVALISNRQSAGEQTAVFRYAQPAADRASSLFAPFSRTSVLKIGNRALTIQIARAHRLSILQTVILAAVAFATLTIIVIALRITTERSKNSRQLRQLVTDLKAKQQILDKEQELAGQVFAKIVGAGSRQHPQVSSWSRAMQEFSGDLVLTNTSKRGLTYVMTCDFTGHGLPAALGALPVSLIFNAMVNKDCGIGEIISELNAKLLEMLPTDVFCCAALIVLDECGRSCWLWNGGLPLVVHVAADGTLKERMLGDHLPLGILDYKHNEASPRHLELMPGDSLYVYTDGLTEAMSGSGEVFSERGLLNVLATGSEQGHRIADIQRAVNSHLGAKPPGDDITVIEVSATIANADSEKSSAA